MSQIKPLDDIERIPKDFEKRLLKMKATEYQTLLLFYFLAILEGYLDKKYLDHIGLLSSGLYTLLKNNISPQELAEASNKLEKFYKQFAQLYGEGSCGLNVHNIGVHLAEFVGRFGPLWCHSTFPFEDLNSSILHVHGTGDVTKQAFRLKENKMHLTSLLINKSIPAGKHLDYIRKLLNDVHHSWKKLSPSDSEGVKIAGAITKIQNPSPAIIHRFGPEARHCFRIMKGKKKFYARGYTRMKKRVCYYVSDVNGKHWLMDEFIIDPEKKVYAACFEVTTSKLDNNFSHMLKVESVSDQTEYVEVERLCEKVMFIDCGRGPQYLIPMPNPYGHAVFK